MHHLLCLTMPILMQLCRGNLVEVQECWSNLRMCKSIIGSRWCVRCFSQKLCAAVAQMKVGDGFEVGAQIGPLINQGAVNKVETLVEGCGRKGAKGFARR